MACLKCGRDTEEMFCESCREKMKEYPVRPGTVVQLPNREHYYATKVRKHSFSDPEKLNAVLKKRIKNLRVSILVLIVVILIQSGLMIFFYQRTTGRQIGQNYSTVSRSTEETAAPEQTE